MGSLFYTILNNEKYLTLSLIYADKKIDSGNIIAKARYPLNKFLTIKDLRKIDDNLVLFILKREIFELLKGQKKVLIQDIKKETFYEKRYPKDSEIDNKKSISELYDFIRAIPEKHSAFFLKDGIKVKIKFEIDYTFKFNNNDIIYETYKIIT